METITMESSAYKDLVERIDRIAAFVCKSEKDNATETKLLNGERLFDNQDLCLLLQVSKRSLQRYRSTGLLPYQMLRHKTYYKESDVLNFITAHIKDYRKEDAGIYKARIHSLFK
ncbi:helix-turn-helix domain-containing protein [Bacteroides graminisolvens]|uniref:helix-turn-helix domain-containing protein n=1 Tax=Bacteroides graminisolvens TaxID=477666 RepID=UPI0024090345|nr:helix-turn-helix domain-containing protein [Bacteroides graminisolvens]